LDIVLLLFEFGFVWLRPKTAQNRVLKLDSWLAFTRLGLI
jgi:hypothetical protein